MINIWRFFDWLKLLDTNVYVFLILIGFVAVFNMGAILFILIMERTQMIGLLKALGARDLQIRKIFFWNGMRILGRGLLIGNSLGLGIGVLQYYFHLIPLNPEKLLHELCADRLELACIYRTEYWDHDFDCFGAVDSSDCYFTGKPDSVHSL